MEELLYRSDFSPFNKDDAAGAIGDVSAFIAETIAKYGGRYLVRGASANPKLIEGGPEPKVIVILEFPDSASFDRWYKSPEYQKILPHRLQNSKGRLFTLEGMMPA